MNSEYVHMCPHVACHIAPQFPAAESEEQNMDVAIDITVNVVGEQA